MYTLQLERVQQVSQKHGFYFLGHHNIEASFVDERLRLKQWQERGYAADLSYMQRAAEGFNDFNQLLPSCESVLCFAVPYSAQQQEPLLSGHARIARYALGRDYHRVIPRKLKNLMAEIAQQVPTLEYRIFSDAAPLLERAMARRAGLGFIGKNSMLIRPRLGSYFFLSEVLINQRIEEDSTLKILDQSCGRCERCRSDCPTAALVDDYTLDSNRCISYLTIEKRGVFSHAERRMLDSWIFGCDICQECCPFNHAPAKDQHRKVFEEFLSSQWSTGQIDLDLVLSLTSDELFLKVFAGTPLMRAKREGLLRNACCVAALQKYDQFIEKFEHLIEFDQSAVIRAHALWALMHLQESDSKKNAYLQKLADDKGIQVQQEMHYWRSFY